MSKMNNQIGFYIPLVSNTQLSQQIINVLNNISSKYNTVLFNSQYDFIDQEPRKFSVLHCNQSKYFYGILFAFDINSISIIDHFPAPHKKIFVTSDIFWQNKTYPAKVSHDLIMNNIDVITYNSKAYDLYDICFKKPLINMNNGLTSEDFLNVVDSIFSA
jgi:hypothetical protein